MSNYLADCDATLSLLLSLPFIHVYMPGHLLVLAAQPELAQLLMGGSGRSLPGQAIRIVPVAPIYWWLGTGRVPCQISSNTNILHIATIRSGPRSVK
jgi:hypothetical protein